VYAGEPINSDEPMTGHGADLVALDHVTKERDAALAERDAARGERDALRDACSWIDDWDHNHIKLILNQGEDGKPLVPASIHRLRVIADGIDHIRRTLARGVVTREEPTR